MVSSGLLEALLGGRPPPCALMADALVGSSVAGSSLAAAGVMDVDGWSKDSDGRRMESHALPHFAPDHSHGHPVADTFELFLLIVALVPVVMSLRKRMWPTVQQQQQQQQQQHTMQTGATGSLQLPLRRTREELRTLDGMKTLVNFVLFFCTFALLTMWRVDWWKGAETLHWLNEAHDEVGRRPISETETTAQVATMLEDGIPTVISHLKSICLTCGVGVTPEQQDLAFLGLDAFVCSDFDSLPGKTTYPRRDCPEVDASWAARPTSDSAPCCGNATLVTASIAMMVEALVYKTTTMPLDTLLSGGSDPSFSSTEFFVTHYIDLYSFIMQLVVSQRGRMAAVQYHARWVDREDAPGRVKPSATFWSFNYQPNSTMELLRLGMLFLGLLTVLHDRRAVLRAFRYGTLSHALAELDKTLSNTYVTAIEVPSTLLPVALEIFRPFLPLPTWTFWVTASQMLMVVRLFSESHPASPLSLGHVVGVLSPAHPSTRRDP